MNSNSLWLKPGVWWWWHSGVCVYLYFFGTAHWWKNLEEMYTSNEVFSCYGNRHQEKCPGTNQCYLQQLKSILLLTWSLVNQQQQKVAFLLMNPELAITGDHRASIKISSGNPWLGELYLVVQPVWAFLMKTGPQAPLRVSRAQVFKTLHFSVLTFWFTL